MPSPRPPRLPCLGIDIGGVLVAMASESNEDTSFFGSRPMETPAQPGAFDAVAELVDVFEGRVHVVSKAGPKIEGVSRSWLAAQDFYAATGLSASHLHFVRQRREKASVCRRLGVTHFVDDRVDVLESMPEVAHRYLFLPGRDGSRPSVRTVPPALVPVSGWPDVVARIGALR